MGFQHQIGHQGTSTRLVIDLVDQRPLIARLREAHPMPPALAFLWGVVFGAAIDVILITAWVAR